MAAAPLAHVPGTMSRRQVRPPLAIRHSDNSPVPDVLTSQPVCEFAKLTTGAVESS